jgi:nicotinamidase-related amidase
MTRLQIALICIAIFMAGVFATVFATVVINGVREKRWKPLKINKIIHNPVAIYITLFMAFILVIWCGMFLQRVNFPNTFVNYLYSVAYHIANPSRPVEIVLHTRKITDREQTIDLNSTALVIIDAAQEACDLAPNREAENMSTKLVALLDLARKYNIKVIHSPNGYHIADIVKPIPGEYVVGYPYTAEILDSYLKRHGIDTLLYAGYDENVCLIARNTGIIKMSGLGYKIILVRDCTVAYESPESLPGEWGQVITTETIEFLWGESTTLNDLETALQKVYQ